MNAKTNRSDRSPWPVLAFLIFQVATAGVARAQPPAVYHSPLDDGAQPSGLPNLPSGTSATVHLYIDGGPNPSTSDPCEAGAGDEVCGFDLSFATTGAVAFVSFVPDGDIVYQLQASQLRFNGLHSDVGDLGPTRLGEIVISSTGNGAVVLDDGYSVASNLDLVNLSAKVVTSVPEPGFIPALAAGGTLLSVLRGRRRNEPTLASLFSFERQGWGRVRRTLAAPGREARSE